MTCLQHSQVAGGRRARVGEWEPALLWAHIQAQGKLSSQNSTCLLLRTYWPQSGCCGVPSVLSFLPSQLPCKASETQSIEVWSSYHSCWHKLPEEEATCGSSVSPHFFSRIPEAHEGSPQRSKRWKMSHEWIIVVRGNGPDSPLPWDCFMFSFMWEWTSES